MGRIIFFVIFICFLSAATCFALDISADTAIVMDEETGEILFAKNIHKQRPPASVTKILTTYIALEKGDLDSVVTVSRKAASVGGSSLYLQEGEKLPLIDLLFGVMLSSGNDAATAVAEHISGSIEEFAALMNKMAKQIGAKNSNFANPHGLHDPEHLTTAYDMALITQQAFQNPLFAQIVATKTHYLNYEGLSWHRGIRNINRLIWTYSWADGVKTGYTSAAGRCLVASGIKEDRRVIAVLLYSPNRWQDADRLLRLGLEKFTHYSVIEEGEKIFTVNTEEGNSIPIYADRDLKITIPREESVIFTRRIVVPQNLRGFIPQGAPVGRLEITYADKTYVIQLLLGEEIPPPSLFKRIKTLVRNIWPFHRT